MWGLTASCLWFDEIFSIHAAEHPWNSILSFVALDLIHPPLFYLLLKAWMSIGGDGLMWLRSLPAVLSFVAIVPFLGICRELRLNGWAGLLALFLFSVNGSMIKYAQEVRMYSLLLCLSLFSIWFFARYFNRGGTILPLLVVNVLLVHTHYFGWFVVASQLTAVIWLHHKQWRPVAAMAAVVGLAFLPWAAAVWKTSGTGTGLSQNIGWMSRPGAGELAVFLLNLVEPFYFQTSSAEAASFYFVSVPLVILILAAAVSHFAVQAESSIERRHLQLLSLFVLIPIFAAFAASWVMPYSIWGTRHLTLVFAPFAVMLGVLVTSLRPSYLSRVAVGVMLLLAAAGFASRALRTPAEYSWCAWEPLTASANADAPIYFFEDLVAYHVWFALRKENAASVIKASGIQGLTEDKAYFLPRGFDSVKSADLADIEDRRLWLAFRSSSVSDSESPLRNFLVKGYAVAERRIMRAGAEDAALILMEKVDQ